MTMPEERYLAVVQAREFMVQLVTGRARPLAVVKDEARKILKHYPARYEMEWAAAQAPKVFTAVTVSPAPKISDATPKRPLLRPKLPRPGL